MVYKHFVVHPKQVTDAHMAACAAQRQGKFMEFMAAFWEKGYKAYGAGDRTAMGAENILKIAGELGLDADKIKVDMYGPECKKRLQDDYQELNKFKVSGTPAFFVNGKSRGFAGEAAFNKLIEEELAAVTASGVAPNEYYQKVVMAGEKQFKVAPRPGK